MCKGTFSDSIKKKIEGPGDASHSTPPSPLLPPCAQAPCVGCVQDYADEPQPPSSQPHASVMGSQPIRPNNEAAQLAAPFPD